jgi:hypothetical protein
MKLLRVAFFCFFVLTGFSSAQKYHSPDEIYKLINESGRNYRIKTFAGSDTALTEEHPVLEHGLILWQGANGQPTLTTWHTVLQKNVYLAGYLATAEKALAAARPAAARRALLAVLAQAPEDAQDMTLIGQTCALEGDSSKAAACYRKAIAANYRDFLAHQLLACEHVRHHRTDSARAEMITAHILNRNHADLLQEFKVILQKSNSHYEEWEFRPLYNIEETTEAKIVKYDLTASAWLSYGMCKALWKYEPGYADSVMQNCGAPADFIEEIECVQTLLHAHQAANEPVQDRGLQQLALAAKEDLLREFILYEILLRRNPYLVFYLSEAQIADVAKYVHRFRIK